MTDIEAMREELAEAEENTRYFAALEIARKATGHNLAAQAASESADSWARKAESLRFSITRALLKP